MSEAAAVRLPAALAEAILAHLRAALPDEGCGLLLASASGELAFVPARNVLAAPDRFEIDPAVLAPLLLAEDEGGPVLRGIVHGHPRTAARPSARDLEGARLPGLVHLIAGPLEGSAPVELRAWRLDDGRAEELTLEVGAGGRTISSSA
jgi:proteasome lid subunit RPN8/RPN11